MKASTTGSVQAIWIKRFKGGAMDPVEQAQMVAGQGLDGNANQGGKRQVTLLEAEAWEAIASELREKLDPASRRANLLIRGISLQETRNRVLCIGACRLLIHGETRPCERMEETRQGLLEVMKSDWRGGVYGEVLQGGEISVGDSVRWEESLLD